MGMSAGSGSPNAVKNDINVTPLIDVLLVLLIIFLVIIPIMMKMETLDVPRKLDDINEQPDPDASQLTIKVKADMSIVFNDGNTDQVIQANEIAKTLRPKLESLHMGKDKVVFVEFDDAVPWNQVVTTMDSVRSLANDASHDEIKVALKLKEDKPVAP